VIFAYGFENIKSIVIELTLAAAEVADAKVQEALRKLQQVLFLRIER
jgi:hypothetical protein